MPGEVAEVVVGESLRDALTAAAEPKEAITPEVKVAEPVIEIPISETTVEEPPVSEEPITEAAVEEPKPPAVDEAPKNWAEADKAMFKSVPTEAQKFLLRRHAAMEADYTRKTQEISAFKKDFEPIEQILRPHYDQMKASGFTPATLVKAWFDVERSLAEGKGLEVVSGIIKGYNIDPAAVIRSLHGTSPPSQQYAQPPAAGNTEVSLPPAVLAELERLRSDVSSINQERQMTARQKQLELETQTVNTITSFVEAKDPEGNLLHPHFSDVEDDMAILANAARAAGRQVPSLDDLYQKAVWANTSTREKLLSSQRQADEKKRQDEARAKAAAAKKASSSVQGAPGSGLPAQAKSSTASVREALLEAMADT